jgi:2'-5' RNA ligase
LEGGDQLRLFVALLLPEEARNRLSAWQGREIGSDRDLRIVPRENLHVTVAFLGSRPAAEAKEIAGAVRIAARTHQPPLFEPLRYRETGSVSMIVLADEKNRGALLAEEVFHGLERLGAYERERRPWLPHVTVARFRTRPRLSPPPPDLGRVVSSEMAVMISRLRRSGAQYEVLESVPVGG